MRKAVLVGASLVAASEAFVTPGFAPAPVSGTRSTPSLLTLKAVGKRPDVKVCLCGRSRAARRCRVFSWGMHAACARAWPDVSTHASCDPQVTTTDEPMAPGLCDVTGRRLGTATISRPTGGRAPPPIAANPTVLQTLPMHSTQLPSAWHYAARGRVFVQDVAGFCARILRSALPPRTDPPLFRAAALLQSAVPCT
jgi:hypothetical protein